MALLLICPAAALRLALASVMSHGGETSALFAFYSDLLRATKARPFQFCRPRP